MTWFRVDDGFADHPKTLRVSLAAIGLWTKAGAWCSKHLTNGEVPQAAVTALGGSSKLARELVSAGLWRMLDGVGYAFHEWVDHQPTRDEILAKRAATRERVTRHRSKPKPAEEQTGNALRNAVTNASGNATPVPTRPVSMQACSAEDVSREWHSAMHEAGVASLHTAHSWLPDYETCASACNAVDGDQQLAAVALCRWFWLAPDGPVQAGRVRMHFATPGHLAKHVSTDLLAAAAWWANQQEAAQ